MTEERRHSQRGFRIFMERERSEDERLYGKPATVTVSESSIAFRGAHVRIYEGEDCVQLNVEEAAEVCRALAVFVVEAEDGELTEPARWEEA